MNAHERFVQSLAPEDEQLVILRDYLYEGDWSELERDLKARLRGKPVVFKLNTRIEEDLERIEKLRAYERRHSIDLGHFVTRSGRFPEPASRGAAAGRGDDTDDGRGRAGEA